MEEMLDKTILCRACRTFVGCKDLQLSIPAGQEEYDRMQRTLLFNE